VRAFAPRWGAALISSCGLMTKHQARRLIILHASVEQMSFAVLTIAQ